MLLKREMLSDIAQFLATSSFLPRTFTVMHFSAKRGIAIACRLSLCPSVCLSVTLVDCDHIGWNSSEIISNGHISAMAHDLLI